MQPLRILKISGLVGAVALISSLAFGATITGKVTGPDGAPFRAAFVQARNAKTHVTVIVLSGNDGTYRVENLPAGNYQVQARSIGYRSDSKSGIFLAANQNATFDWALQKQMVHWDEIPIIQGIDLVSGRSRQRKICPLRLELPRVRAIHQRAAGRKRMARNPQGHDVHKNRRQRCVRHDQERPGRQ